MSSLLIIIIITTDSKIVWTRENTSDFDIPLWCLLQILQKYLVFVNKSELAIRSVKPVNGKVV